VELVCSSRLPAFLRDYPNITVELIVDNGCTNIVERQCDAGVRRGEAIARDMVAGRMGPDVSDAGVGSPKYVAARTVPA
ncbi:LysR family transcriptional regulator, partial [Rhizobium leguminosarum]